MPVSEALPYEWYNTPNIHLCTFKDFEQLCAQHDIHIINRFAVSDSEKGHKPLMTALIRQDTQSARRRRYLSGHQTKTCLIVRFTHGLLTKI